MNTPNPSRWGELFDQAMMIIDQANGQGEIIGTWTFGGGTALMLHIGHRESHDIDLFIDDPQALPYLNPYTQDYHLEVAPSSYDTDGTRALKLSFDGVGEIDFICTGTLSEAPTVEATVRGRKVLLETPLEIVTKKLVYRGSHIQPRDMFDIAAVAMVRDPNELIAGLRPYTDECRIALAATERFSPAAAITVMCRLMIREGFEGLPDTAQGTVIRLLRSVVGGETSVQGSHR